MLDVLEHAWTVDYGAGEKGKYVKAFLENVSWKAVEQRDSANSPGPRMTEELLPGYDWP